MKKLILVLLALVLLLLPPSSAFSGGQTVSGKTVDDLVTEARYILNESASASGKMWTDAEIETWINDAVRNIIARTHCLESSEQHTLDSGTSEYTISNDYVFVKTVLYQSGETEFRALLPSSVDVLGYVPGDEPKHFYEYNGKVGVFPLKDSRDATVSGNTIYVYYVPMQETLSGTSSIPTPASFDRAILYYTISQAFLKDGQMDRSDRFWSQYSQEIDRYRMDFLERKKSIWEIIAPRQERYVPTE